MAESLSLAPRRLSVRDLEEELNALWKETHRAESAEGHEEPPLRTRSAVLTLVMVVMGEEAVKEASAIVTRLVEQTPCRAIVIDLEAEPGADGAVAAFASAHCHTTATGRHVCCEEVRLRAAPGGDIHLSSLVLPLLVPDLPVILDWPGVATMMSPAPGAPHTLPRGAQFLCDLDPYVDIVILDSALAGDPDAFIANVAALAARPAGPGMRPSDRNWARLLPWREGIADVVDHCHLDVSRIREVEILVKDDAAPGAPVTVGPRLLAGWLRDRLPAADVRLDLECGVACPPGSRPGPRIGRVTLRLDGGEEVSVERADDWLRICRGGVPDQRLPRGGMTEEERLCTLIAQRRTDPLYLRALQKAGG